MDFCAVSTGASPDEPSKSFYMSLTAFSASDIVFMRSKFGSVAV